MAGQEYKGAWYVALLVPLYLVYPLMVKWMKTRGRILKGVGIIAVIAVTQIIH